MDLNGGSDGLKTAVTEISSSMDFSPYSVTRPVLAASSLRVAAEMPFRAASRSGIVICSILQAGGLEFHHSGF